jgi:hypothetical protein
MSNVVASQFIRHDFARLIPVALEQTPEESLGDLAISARLQKHINDFAIPINCPPEIHLLALNFGEGG